MKEDFIPIKEGRKYGYLDPTGLIVIEPRFDLAFPFYEGMALVAVIKKAVLGKAVNRYGYIDRTGRLAIKPVFREAFSFSGGFGNIVSVGLEASGVLLFL